VAPPEMVRCAPDWGCLLADSLSVRGASDVEDPWQVPLRARLIARVLLQVSRSLRHKVCQPRRSAGGADGEQGESRREWLR